MEKYFYFSTKDYVQKQKRYVPEIPFQNPFEAENQLDALLITRGVPVIKKKCPLSRPIGTQKFCPVCDNVNNNCLVLVKNEVWSKDFADMLFLSL